MKTKSAISNLIAAALAIVPVLALTGCGNVGNENPITPESMQKMRERESADRANFKPTNTAPPRGQ